MPFKNQTGYNFTTAGIVSAPSASGVYGIYNRTSWIYIGESGDIAARLGEHFSGSSNSNPDILKNAPTAFTYELVPAAQRVQREYQLIAELKPLANK
jgi:excinuclease UvrABC nuclease subunit